ITANRYAHAPKPIMDRQIDFLVGIPLVIVALLLITLAPVIASTYYWTDRADVVSMAMFAAGATIIAYGITWFWRLKAAFLFLLLMWPALYLHLMAGVMQSFSNWTNAMMAQVVHHLPLGASLGSNAGDVIINQASGSPLTISIGTACSGADTVLGFALVGGAVLTVLGGGKGRKLLWWVAGMVMAFALNIIRLTSIIALAHAGHPSFALGGYHAVIGLVLFAIAVLVMLWALPWFGLHLKEPIAPVAKSSVAPPAPIAPAPDHVSGPVAGMTIFGATHARSARAWTRGRKIATGAVLLLTAFVALADHGLQPYAAFDDGSGAPTVKPFVATAAAPAGWQVFQIAEYSWAKQYFGDNSTWNRYSVVPPHSHGIAYADVVLTSDKSTLDTYNLLNCFLFHNYDIRTSERVDLGGGVYGLLLNYSDPATNTKWGTVSWAWPVTYKGDTYYERIALTSSPIQGSAAASAPSFQPQGGIQDIFLDLLNGVSGGHNDPAAAPLFRTVDNALQSEAQVLVHRAVQRGV
ncbi:MAG TPA: exosortase/archaeosortase family protein, partial [Candidatus Acidoferrales bacterium]|nr:exosortase/archaeosortase family protein [Candidatus Acidoferrales bacterium]